MEGTSGGDDGLRTSAFPHHLMKRLGTWLLYVVGTLAIAYLALYAYAMFTGHDLQPGDPIRIFRNPDAPDYSQAGSLNVIAGQRVGAQRSGEFLL